jgi:response regulator RpfG family c-di-GMP phosphodiesterase
MNREILIIEDDPGVNNLLARVAIDAEYKPVAVANGSEAFRFISSKLPALVLLDLNLPDMPGTEILEYFRSNGIDVPVIVVSANRDISTVVECYNSGIYDYVTKPFNVARIKEAITNAAQKYNEGHDDDFYNNTMEERVFLQQEWLEETKNEYGQLLNDSLTSLVRIIELKTGGIRDQLERVRAYALHLGKMVGLHQEQLRQLSLGAILHDIGKISVPPGILNKPGPLTAGEWDIIKLHPIVGYGIFKGTKQFAGAAELIYTHHERFDGTGYPRGLRGHQIPVITKVFSVVDAYDSIVSERPYSPAAEPESALEEIREKAGSQFDPGIVASFLEVPPEEWISVGEKERSTLIG